MPSPSPTRPAPRRQAQPTVNAVQMKPHRSGATLSPMAQMTAIHVVSEPMPAADGRADPRVSVVVPTFNRRESLRRLLDALAAQSYPATDFEVVVVDDGS